MSKGQRWKLIILLHENNSNLLQHPLQLISQSDFDSGSWLDNADIWK